MRLAALIVVFSLVFVVAALCAEPWFHSLRLFLFPGLAIAFEMLRAMGVKVAGRATFVWSLATIFNTILYSVMMWFSFWLVRRFRPSERPAQG